MDDNKKDEEPEILKHLTTEEKVQVLHESVRVGTAVATFLNAFKEMLIIVILFYIMLSMIRHEPLVNFSATFNDKMCGAPD